MFNLSARLANTREFAPSEGWVSRPVPKVSRVAGPVIRPVLASTETRHKLALSYSRATSWPCAERFELDVMNPMHIPVYEWQDGVAVRRPLTSSPSIHQ
jgi:hypothetical protein